MKHNKTVLAFDADDTLWLSEIYYRTTEAEVSSLLSDGADHKKISETISAVKLRNLVLYGYGVKGFILSLLEAALEIFPKVTTETIEKIIAFGKHMIGREIELLPDVLETLKLIPKENYMIVLVTKGDLLDQQNKLLRSGLSKYFDHVEIMADKTRQDYLNLINKLNVSTSDFIMIGNSVRSDILPVLDIGGQAIYIPSDIIWEHEAADIPVGDPNFSQSKSFGELLALI